MSRKENKLSKYAKLDEAIEKDNQNFIENQQMEQEVQFIHLTSLWYNINNSKSYEYKTKELMF